MQLSIALLAASVCVAGAASLPTPPGGKPTVGLPSSFEWVSTGELVGPKNDGRGIAGIKDPSVVEIDGTYHVFASTAQESGYSMVYFNFTDFSKANESTFFYLDQSGIGTGYRAAPQVYYFKPHKLWYLIFQNGNAAWSTNEDINNPAGWTAPTNFYDGEPDIIAQNIGNGYWVDIWTICDDFHCYLFCSDDNGHFYRSQTELSNFPHNMSDPIIAMEDTDNKFALYEASCVYHLTSGGYLLLIEAIGSDGNRYFRSWTSPTINGNWTGLAASEANPFARSTNVAYIGTPWTHSISHGEMIRTMTDQTLTISPCNLRFLYQGVDPSANGSDYNALPWRLGLITQTNSLCCE